MYVLYIFYTYIYVEILTMRLQLSKLICVGGDTKFENPFSISGLSVPFIHYGASFSLIRFNYPIYNILSKQIADIL